MPLPEGAVCEEPTRDLWRVGAGVLWRSLKTRFGTAHLMPGITLLRIKPPQSRPRSVEPIKMVMCVGMLGLAWMAILELGVR